MVRIISGDKKGHKLLVPKKLTRPTIDRVKESLFNIINAEIKGRSLLDMFSGSGSVGLEALSRGASEVVMIEKNSEACAIIKKNIAKLGFEKNYKLLCANAFEMHKHISYKQFDVVFIDPPYAKGLQKKSLNYLQAENIIHDGSLIVAESSSKEDLPEEIGLLTRTRTAKYGDCCLHFYRFTEHNDSDNNQQR